MWSGELRRAKKKMKRLRENDPTGILARTSNQGKQKEENREPSRGAKTLRGGCRNPWMGATEKDLRVLDASRRGESGKEVWLHAASKGRRKGDRVQLNGGERWSAVLTSLYKR